MAESDYTEVPMVCNSNDGRRIRYDENCGACKFEQLKRLRTGFPLRNISIVSLIMLCSSLPITSLFPYLYFMIKDFKIAGREEDLGYYVGFVGSSFMVGRALTAILWGMFSDRYGRKPVIFIGLVTVVIFNFLFGLSVNFWMAISTRFLLGTLNGLLGPLKALTSELVPEEHYALGMSAIGTAWGIGLVIGPAVGGFLAQPAEKYPIIFSEDGFFGRFPYFLPNLFISICALGVGIASFASRYVFVLYLISANKMTSLASTRTPKKKKEKEKSTLRVTLVETLHMHKDGSRPSYDSRGTRETYESGEELPSKSTRRSLLTNWPLMSSILVFCVFGLHDIAYSEIFSLWAVSPRRFGGLNYSTEVIGEVLSISGFGLLFLQLSMYPFLVKLLGPLVLSRICGVLYIPLLTSYTYIAKLPEPFRFVVLNCASLLRNLLLECIVTTLFILHNKAVEQDQRGAANGISTTAMSIFKAAGPVGGGALFSWAIKRPEATFLPGVQIVFFFLNVITAIGTLMTFEPFLVLP